MKYNPSTSAASNFKINVRATSTSYLILGGGSNYWVNVIERFIFRRRRRRRLHSAVMCICAWPSGSCLMPCRSSASQKWTDRLTTTGRKRVRSDMAPASARLFFLFVLSINTKTIKIIHTPAQQTLFYSILFQSCTRLLDDFISHWANNCTHAHTPTSIR